MDIEAFMKLAGLRLEKPKVSRREKEFNEHKLAGLKERTKFLQRAKYKMNAVGMLSTGDLTVDKAIINDLCGHAFTLQLTDSQLVIDGNSPEVVFDKLDLKVGEKVDTWLKGKSVESAERAALIYNLFLSLYT